MTMYDTDRSGSLGFNEFAQLTGYLNSANQHLAQTGGATAQGVAIEDAVKAVNMQHGGILASIGGIPFVRSLIAFFDQHRTGVISVGVFVTVLAIIGIIIMLIRTDRKSVV